VKQAAARRRGGLPSQLPPNPSIFFISLILIKSIVCLL
jgi:hypothetical protein